MSNRKIELPGGLANFAEPQQQAFVLEQPDGSKQLLPIVMLGMLSDYSLEVFKQVLHEVVSEELDARGLTAIPKFKAV